MDPICNHLCWLKASVSANDRPLIENIGAKKVDLTIPKDIPRGQNRKDRREYTRVAYQ